MDRDEIKKIIKSNKWYTFDEAEKYLRKHWNPDNKTNKEYLVMNRRQIQKILRSDIIGTYLKINEKIEGLSEEDIILKEIYGWESQETFNIYELDKENNKYITTTHTETLFVFPKYANQFSKGEVSIILSSFDEQLDDRDKMEIREIYEDIFQPSNRGKIPYLMTERYLFALKHEIERREYPIKNLYLKPHAPKEIRLVFSKEFDEDSVIDCIDYFLDSFNEKVRKEIKSHNDARNVEKERYRNLIEYLNTWSAIYKENFKKIILKLITDGLWDDFLAIVDSFDEEIVFVLNIECDKRKLHEKFVEDTIITKSKDEVSEKLSKSIYSYEQYNLGKLETTLSKDTEFTANALIFRKKFVTVLKQYIQEVFRDESDLLLDSLSNIT